MNQDSKIGTLDFDACRQCAFCKSGECSVDDQEIQDNLEIDGVVNIHCGCFRQNGGVL